MIIQRSVIVLSIVAIYFIILSPKANAQEAEFTPPDWANEPALPIEGGDDGEGFITDSEPIY